LGIGHGALRTPEGALLSLRARYPDSDRAYTGVTLVAVTGGSTELVPPGVRVAGADSVLLLTRVRRHTGELDVTAEAQELRALLDDGLSYDTLLGRHLDPHDCPMPKPGGAPGGRMEGLDPLEWPAVGEALCGLEVAREQPVLHVGEFGGQAWRAGVFAAVRADEGVLGDDDTVVVRITEHQGAVVAVATQEGVLPAGGRGGLPGAVHGSGGGHDLSTATP
jgi:hypothetical protein